jgi:DNA-binding CsgD family transcriptional regulator
MPDLAATTLSLVERLYDAVPDPDAWPGFLDSLGRAVGGVVPGLYVTNLATDANLLQVTSGMDPIWSNNYDVYFKHHDPRRSRIRELPAGSVFVGPTLLPDRDLIRSEFYNDFLQPQGYFHILGAVPWRSPEAIGVVRVVRPRTAAPFGSHEVDLLRHLLPHLSRALRLHDRLALAETRRAETVDVLDRFSAGVLLLDAAGHPVAVNRAAEALLAAGDTLRTGRDGIRAVLPAETATLQRLVARAAASRPGGASEGVLNLTRPPPQRPLNVLVTPLRGGPLRGAARRAAVVVFVTDPERLPSPPVEGVQRWLGLTRAEAALVAELLRGRRVEEAADTLEISTHTARTQLKRALAKTGTGRQAELLRLALSVPSMLSR